MRRKTYEELEFTDDFMFWNILVYRKDLCKGLIELVLGVNIKEINLVEGQKTIEPKYDGHGIRLDVYVDDEKGTVYDLEMQTTLSKGLPKRTRYYQSVIDMDILMKNEPYAKLKKSFIIFLCTEDAFGKHLPMYTFENVCLQDKNLKLNDEVYKVIVNPDSDRSGLSEEMNSLLDLLQGKAELTGLAKDISDAIIKEKEVQRWRAEYMTLQMKLMEEREEGREEGLAEGLKEGISSANLDRIKSAMKNGPMTFEAACKLLDITKPDKYRNLIK